MKTITENRKAGYNYYLTDKYTAGLVLNGCEIKSIKKSNVNISEAYCVFEKGELWIKGMFVKNYENKGYVELDSTRDRKLLLTKKELRKLEQKVKVKGQTIVPLRIIINDKGVAKLDIALATGKKNYNKAQSIKERDIQRDMERSLM